MVQYLKTIFNFYIKSSIHVAIAVVSLASVSATTVNKSLPNALLIFILCSTVFGYNYIKFFPLFKFDVLRNDLKWIIILSLLSALYSGIFFFTLTTGSKILVLLIGILVLLYSTPLIASRNGREMKGLKTLWVVLSWILLSVGIPILELEYYDLTVVLFLFCLQGIYVFVALLSFEIRDVNTDSPFLNTLPQRIGILRAKVIGYFLILVAIVLQGFAFDTPDSLKLSTWVVFFLLALFLWKSMPNRSFYFTHFWLESLPLFWFVMIEILSNLHIISTQ